MIKVKKYLPIAVLILIIIIALELFIRHDHPKFFNDTINVLKEDQELMSSIGGFSSFEYKFNKNDLKKDTLPFQIIIKGKEGYLLYRGLAIKNQSSKWVVEEKDISIEKGI